MISVSSTPWVSCIVLAPPAGHINPCIVFVFWLFIFYALCSPTVFLPSCFPSGLVVSSLCWRSTSAYHNADRTYKQQLRPLGTQPAPWAHAWWFGLIYHFLCFLSLHRVSFSFLFSFVYPFWPPLCNNVSYTSFLGVRTYVPRLRSWCYPVATTRDGMPQVTFVPPPLRTGTAVDVYCSLFSDHGLDF